jgi:hypothetical protein
MLHKEKRTSEKQERGMDMSIFDNGGINSAHLPKGIVRNTDAIKLRSSSDKVAMGYKPREWHDYCHDGTSDMPKDRERVVPKLATPRPDSPFKRSGKALSSVVIEKRKL